MRLFITFLIGAIFGTGICVAGMADPAKVLNFFDIAGTWDPSLAFVMGGALAVTMLGYRIVLPRGAPLFESKFSLPSNRDIDAKLLGGAAASPAFVRAARCLPLALFTPRFGFSLPR